MRRLSKYAAVLLLAALLPACDSNEDPPTEAELFVGTWRLVRVEDAAGDKTSAVRALGELTVTFEADGSYALVFDFVEGDDRRQDNVYFLNQVDDLLTLTATAVGVTLNVPVTYAFRGEDEIVLTIASEYAIIINAALDQAFGTIEGDVELTIQRTS